jgi:TonB family protein
VGTAWSKNVAILAASWTLLAPALLRAQSGNDQPSPPDPGAVPSGGAGAIRVPAENAPPEPAAQVTPPKILHFEPSEYPPEAEKLGLEANVVLQLDIDKEGKVTKAVVTEPAGHGFDEAAVLAAQKFLFEPARRGATPIPARILYRYGFTLKPAVPEGQPSGQPAAPAPPVDNLRGTVISIEGDVPLAGASVDLENAQGEHTVVSTGTDGSWKFQGLPPGRYKLGISASGFKTVKAEEDVVAGSVTELTYRLSLDEGGIEITVQGQRPPREVTRRTIEQREISRIPGTNGDALRSLQNLPGVARPPGLAGLLIVRGSAPTDTHTFVDGIYVPLVYHFGGLSSVIPTEMLEKIDFYPGNFSAQYGRVMGGIVEVGVRSPKADGKYHGLAQFDLIDGRVMLEGPIPLLKGWNFLVGGRRSWIDVWLKPLLVSLDAGVTTAPVYYDYQAFVETKPTSRSSFRVGLFGSDDRFEVLIRDPAQQDPAFGGNLALRTGFYRIEARYKNDITDNLKFSSVTAYGVDRFDFGVGTFFFRIRNNNVFNRTELSYRPFGGVTLHGGVDLALAPYSVDIRFPQPPRPGEPDPGPFAARPPITRSDSNVAWRPAAYLEAEINPSARSKLVPGFRADYARDTSKIDLSPRLSGRYNIVHEFPRTTIKSGVGLFYQPPQYQESDIAFGSPNLHSNRAIHYSLGFEQEITRPLEVSFEGFYKNLDQLVARVPNALGAYDYTNLGKGYVVGTELLLKYKPDAHFFGWLAYTLSRSVRQEPPNFDTRLFQYDQTHILTVLGSYRLGRGWEFGARLRLVSGPLYTPNVFGIYNADAGAYAPLSGLPFSDRVPTFHQLDIRIDKQWRFNGWSMRTYLDVQNAYNRSNPEGIAYNYNFSQSRVQGFLPIIPSIGIRGEF